MEEFLWFLGILFVIYLVIELWPVLLIGAIILIIVWIYKASEQKEKERIAQEKKEAEERERELQRQKSEISQQINSRLSQTAPDMRGLQNYIASVNPTFSEYAREEAAKHMNEIQKEAIKWSAEGEFAKATESADLLCYLRPDDDNLRAQRKTMQSMSAISSMAKCFVMSEQYGKVNASIIQNMSKLTPEDCRASMQSTGPIYSLWYFAIKQPFDPFSFSVSLQATKRIKAKYYKVLIDPILACMYVAKHQPDANVKAIYPDYLKDAYDFVLLTNDRRQLQAFASALSWIGETDLEQTCKVKIERIKGQTAVA